ncbi:MAG: MFS transporter [Candidatus Aureabacteria bacterium]|nr:MFS transporter [Candidatus Auribacterota bacterium]
MSRKWLNANIVGMGAASFFGDLCYEMATAILPAFIAGMGFSAAVLGAIEGIADAVSSFAKMGAGYYSDKKGIRKPIAVWGYFLTALGQASFILATAWPQVLTGKVISWFGKGIRGPARDAMLSGSVEARDIGKAFGFHRGMDTMGAILGPLAALLLLTRLSYRQIFLCTLIPGLMSVAAFLFFVREVAERPAPHLRFVPAMRMLPRRFKRYLAGVGVFGAGDFSHTLLILMAMQILQPLYGAAVAASSAVALYAIHNVIYAACSFPVGYLGDRLGKRRMLVIGYVLSAVMCAGFMYGVPARWYLALLFMLGGAYIASEDVLEGALAAELLPADLRGTGYGALATVNGIGDFVSSIVVGLLWTRVSPAAGFAYAGAMSVCGACIMWRV